MGKPITNKEICPLVENAIPAAKAPIIIPFKEPFSIYVVSCQIAKILKPVNTASVRTSMAPNTIVWAVIKINADNLPTCFPYKRFPKP